MEKEMTSGQENQDTIGGVQHRLLDGYDGDGQTPPPEFIQKLLEDAPPELRARAEKFAQERGSVEKQNGGD